MDVFLRSGFDLNLLSRHQIYIDKYMLCVCVSFFFRFLVWPCTHQHCFIYLHYYFVCYWWQISILIYFTRNNITFRQIERRKKKTNKFCKCIQVYYCIVLLFLKIVLHLKSIWTIDYDINGGVLEILYLLALANHSDAAHTHYVCEFVH